MTLATEALEALAGLFKVCQKTARDYERDCPGAAECGYWDFEDKASYERARNLLKRTYTNAGQPVPAWLTEESLDQSSDSEEE